MKRYHFILFFLGVLLFNACKKEEEIHPQVETLEATPTSATSAIFKGIIIDKGKFQVLDHGFVYGTSPEINVSWGSKASLGKDAAHTSLEKEIF